MRMYTHASHILIVTRTKRHIHAQNDTYTPRDVAFFVYCVKTPWIYTNFLVLFCRSMRGIEPASLEIPSLHVGRSSCVIMLTVPASSTSITISFVSSSMCKGWQIRATDAGFLQC